MWEVGYAMALECPTILLTQCLNEIPFDIREMETLTYERTRLSATLGKPLHKMILDTLTAHNNRVVKMGDSAELAGELYDWEKIGGEYWFGRFRWMRSADISGFAFIKEEDANMLRGHWWMGEELKFSPNSYREKNGVSLILHRLPDKRIPHWVAKFFNDVKKHGLIGLIP
jgi:hypothetical protein